MKIGEQKQFAVEKKNQKRKRLSHADFNYFFCIYYESSGSNFAYNTLCVTQFTASSSYYELTSVHPKSGLLILPARDARIQRHQTTDSLKLLVVRKASEIASVKDDVSKTTRERNQKRKRRLINKNIFID